MKYVKRCPLLILLAVTILFYGVLTGVPKAVAFAEEQMSKKEYRVETLPEYSANEAGKGSGMLSNTDLSGNSANMDLSGNSISGNGIVSGNDSVSGNGAGDIDAVEFVKVTDDYFADALFIGDSRTVGLKEYSDLKQATFYASTGLTVHKVFSAEIVEVPGSKKKITIEEALTQKKFGKIYFMIGINEMGRGTVDTFMEEYEAVIARLRELQPDAIIYVQAIMRVSTERSEKGDYIHNQGIDERNERIAQLADNRQIFYLDVNPLISDETGGMNKSYSFDGVHLKAEYIPIWTDYLAANGIVN